MATKTRKLAEEMWRRAAAVLRRWIGEAGQIKTEAAAWDTGVSDDTIANYAKGKTCPDLQWGWLMTQNLDPRMAQEFWDEFFDGTDFRVIRINDFDMPTLDANGDGRGDVKDAPIHNAKASEEAAQLQLELATLNGPPTAEKLAKLNTLAASIKHRIECVQQCGRASATAEAKLRVAK